LNYRSIRITAQLHNDEWYVGGGGALGVIGGGRQPVVETGVPRPITGTVVDDEGYSQFEVEETPIETADGSYEVSLSVMFGVPAKASRNAPAIPLMSLAPRVAESGGALGGGCSYYYAVSAIGEDGAESALSFLGRASLAAGSESNRVTLHDLSFAPGTVSFNVYRGLNPSQLLRIAKEEPVAPEWVDAGAVEELTGPPDANYHHANFYWRLELLPETAAHIHSSDTVGNDALRMISNEYRGKLVRITAGKGRGQERTISANSKTLVTLSTEWTEDLDASSKFVIVEPTWSFGALTETSPVSFRVPNREGATIHLSGRAANVHDRECSFDLSPLTRWTIGGAAADNDVPPKPVFVLDSSGNGMCEISGIGFPDFTNTRSIATGSLTVHYWNELTGVTTLSLAQPLPPGSEDAWLTAAGSLFVGSALQIESEIVSVRQISEDGLRLKVERGAFTSIPLEHDAGEQVWHLQRKRFVLPFARGLFGTPAAASYSQTIALPDARISAAELYVTNVKGNSQVGVRCYGREIDTGIRTLSGGQFSMQVNGALSVQSAATPGLNVDASHAVRDILASVLEPATGAPIEVRVTCNGDTYAGLTIPPGGVLCDPVLDGLTLPPLEAGWILGLDVVGVGSDRPGAGLTVTIRL
jgi:hypothetical protein